MQITPNNFNIDIKCSFLCSYLSLILLVIITPIPILSLGINVILLQLPVSLGEHLTLVDVVVVAVIAILSRLGVILVSLFVDVLSWVLVALVNGVMGHLRLLMILILMLLHLRLLLRHLGLRELELRHCTVLPSALDVVWGLLAV